MNFDNLDRWITLSANLAVLVGILIVIVEINQNTQAQNQTAVQAILSLSAEINIASAANPAFIQAAGAIQNSEELTLEQELVLNSTFRAITATHWQVFQLYSDGVLEESLFMTYERRNIANLSDPFFRNWWLENKQSYATDFQAYIDNLD